MEMTQPTVSVKDDAGPFLDYMARTLPGEFDKALRSSGWWLKREIQQGIRGGSPAGRPYSPLSWITTNRVLQRPLGGYLLWTGSGWKNTRRIQRKQRIPSKGWRALGRLYGAVRYRFYKDSRKTVVGWINKSAERLGMIQEEGKNVRITERMRRFFWASGIPLKKETRYIKIPARPTIGPVYEKEEDKIGLYIENKVWDYIRGVRG